MNFFLKKLIRFFLTILFLNFPWILIQGKATSVELPELIVTEDRYLFQDKKGSTHSQGFVNSDKIKRGQSQSLTQALSKEKGLSTEMACAFCGTKPLSINGLKGEHTTLLIDGLDLSSSLSNFYGADLIPLNTIDTIEVYRGSGLSQTAPQSIGGTLNIVTRDILSNGFESSFTLSHEKDQKISLLTTKKISPDSGVLLGIDVTQSPSVDGDNNLISETPHQHIQSFTTKYHRKINEDNFTFRLTLGNKKNKGGSLQHLDLSHPPSPLITADDFIERDVRNRLINQSDENKVSDYIHIDRVEFTTEYNKALSAIANLKFSLGGAQQNQISIYSHGFDYNNFEKIFTGKLEYLQKINDTHLIKIGFDGKTHTSHSESKVLYDLNQFIRDDMSHKSLAGFIQNTWYINSFNELSLALRYDQLSTHWIYFNKDFDRSIFAPRLSYLHSHNPFYTSRISMGLGYRSPLINYETEHGLSHDGFLLDVEHLERAKSLVYSISRQSSFNYLELSAHFTDVENMSYGVDRNFMGLPTLFINSDENYLLSVYDMSYSHQINKNWVIESFFESFHYPLGYKQKLPVAAIESRLSLTSTFDWNKWKTSQKIVMIGERDLSPYGYADHFNIAPSDNPFDSSFGTEGQDQKLQKAPQFFVFDLSFERTFSTNFNVTFSILNVFDYTQTKQKDSPLTWHQHGNHFHLDNFHIWGPQRGRQFYISLNLTH